MSSDQNLSLKGTTVGYHLVRRCEVNRREVGGLIGQSDPAMRMR